MRAAFLILFVAAIGCNRTNPAPSPAPVAPLPTAPSETIANPQYASWATFKPGTRVVVRSTTSTDGHDGKTTTTTTTTLVGVTPDAIDVETRTKSRRYDGHEEDNPPSVHQIPKELVRPAGLANKTAGENGEETIAVNGREHKTTWQKGKDRNEAGEVLVQTWMSDAVPGRLVKSVSRTAAVGKTTTIELVEVTEGR